MTLVRVWTSDVPEPERLLYLIAQRLLLHGRRVHSCARLWPMWTTNKVHSR